MVDYVLNSIFKSRHVQSLFKNNVKKSSNNKRNQLIFRGWNLRLNIKKNCLWNSNMILYSIWNSLLIF